MSEICLTWVPFGLVHHGRLILNLDAQFSYPPDAHLLRVFSVTVDGEEEIGDKAREHLHHNAIGGPSNEMCRQWGRSSMGTSLNNSITVSALSNTVGTM